MRKKLLEVRDNMKFYALDRITCFEHPVAVILENYRRYYGSYTYMFIKIVQAYNISTELTSEDLVIQFWHDYLGIDIVKSRHESDVLKVVKENIDKDLPVLIIGNLIELFYSDKYKSKNWSHLFLVTGYDEEKKIIFLLDNTQLRENSKYQSFAITSDIMDKMMTKATWFQPNDMVFTFKKNLQFNTKSDKEIMVYLLNIFCQGISRNKFKELEHLNKLHQLLINPEYDSEKLDYYIEITTWNFVNVIKKKEVFIEELITQMERFEYPENKINMLFDIKRNLHYIWEKFNNRELVKCLRKKKDYNPIVPDEIYSHENELKMQLHQCVNYLEEYNDIDANVNQIDFYTENNDTGIIILKFNTLHFCFNDNKIYNSWLDDECPKLFLARQLECSKKYRITTTVFIEENFKESSFQVGLFIKYDNKIYYGAIDNDDKLIFDIWGYSNLESSYNFKSAITLFLEYSNENIDFGIIEDNEAWTRLHRPFFPSGNFDMGIACKTWGNGMFLDVQIIDYKIEEI